MTTVTPFKVIQGHRFWYQSKAHMQLTILVINTNLPPIVYRFQVMADYSSNFRQREAVPISLSLSLGVIPCQYRHKYYIVKNYIIVWPTFRPQKVYVYLQPLLRNPPRKLPNSVKLRSR